MGSGEAIFNQGSKGIIYALSSALGLFSLILISPFYWKQKLAIWKLLRKAYGEKVEKITAFLSVIWMLGAIATQIIGGGAALNILGVNLYCAMIIISILIILLSMQTIEKISKIFTLMLIGSTIILIYILYKNGLHWISLSLSDFLSNKTSIAPMDISGIVIPTVLITFLGMDFHQFIVKAKTKRDAIIGAFGGGVILLFLSILILGIVYSSIKLGLVGNITDAKQTLPMILYAFGGKYSKFIGVLMFLPLIVVSVGSGSGVNKIVASTIKDLAILPSHLNKSALLVTISVIFSFLVALTGNAIVKLVVSFYAIYIGAMFIPFVFYLLSKRFNNIQTSSNTFMNSLIIGTISSLLTLVLGFLNISPFSENPSSYIALFGFLGTFSVLTISITLQKLVNQLH